MAFISGSLLLVIRRAISPALFDRTTTNSRQVAGDSREVQMPCENRAEPRPDLPF
ncbi:MAG: hypothetical protein MZV49_21175 [Rhodopseudomonas palustris]|nr:hypothetical protein [Rhodopseudomonas palustris]